MLFFISRNQITLEAWIFISILTNIFANISAHAWRRWLKLWQQGLFFDKKLDLWIFFSKFKNFTLFRNKVWNKPIHISYLHFPHGSIDQNRLIPDRVPKSRTGPGRIKVSKPGPDQTRTKKTFEPWDRTGPGTRKISKYQTGPGPTKFWKSIRTGRSPYMAVRGSLFPLEPIKHLENAGHLGSFYVK